MAQETGGTYENAQSDNALDAAFKHIDQLHPSEIPAPPEIQIHSLAWVAWTIFVLISIIWLVFEQWNILSPFRFRTPQGWTLTRESVTFRTIPLLLWMKRVGIIGGILGACLLCIPRTTESPSYIAIVIDVSKSMLTEDVSSSNSNGTASQSRIERAKVIAKQIIEAFPNAQRSQTIFSSQSQTRIPFTYESAALTQAVDDIRAGTLNGATNIPRTLREVFERFNGKS
jgi:hypothetical protein